MLMGAYIRVLALRALRARGFKFRDADMQLRESLAETNEKNNDSATTTVTSASSPKTEEISCE